LPAGRALRAVGVLLFSYARLKLQLRIDGRDAHFHFYDWRLGLDEVGAQLASRIAAEGRPVTIIAHSMGGLVARMAARMLPNRLVRKLIMLGTPNEGSFAAVQALRGTYPFVRKMALLDRRHSADQLAERVFGSFPGLYHMLPRAALEGHRFVRCPFVAARPPAPNGRSWRGRPAYARLSRPPIRA